MTDQRNLSIQIYPIECESIEATYWSMGEGATYWTVDIKGSHTIKSLLHMVDDS